MSYSDTWIAFDNDLNKMLDAFKRNYVLCRMAVSQRAAGANMSVDVESGDCIAYEIYRTFYTTSNVTVAAAHATLPRKDLVCVKTDGTIVSSGVDANCKGTAEAAVPGGSTGPTTTSPKPPNIPANYLLLAEVWVPAAAGSIVDADITDRRILAPQKFPWNMGDMKDYSMIYSGPCVIKGGYLTLRLADNMRVHTTNPLGCSIVRLSYTSATLRRGYGIYQWKYKHAGHEAGKSFCHPLFWGGMCSYGGAYFMQKSDASLKTLTGWNVSSTETALVGWDPTAETTLKIEWTAASVKFYVGGALKNTHNTDVPQEELPIGFEIAHVAKDTDYAADSWIYFKDWERIA